MFKSTAKPLCILCIICGLMFPAVAGAAIRDWNAEIWPLLISGSGMVPLPAGDSITIPPGSYIKADAQFQIEGTCTIQSGATLGIDLLNVTATGTLIVEPGATVELDRLQLYTKTVNKGSIAISNSFDAIGNPVVLSTSAFTGAAGATQDHVVLNPDGGTIPNFNAGQQVWLYGYDTTTGLPSDVAPVRSGYTFSGWSPALPTPGNPGTQVIAQWRLASPLPKTGDNFPLWEMAATAALLLGASAVLMVKARKAKRN